MEHFKSALAASIAALSIFISSPATATAGFIALEGSDATAYHQDPQYSPQLFSYLQGSSSLPVLVLGTQTLSFTGGVPVVYATGLSGQTLSDYSALYIESPGGCCAADPTAIDGFGAAVSAFISAGGNFSIENYIGGTYDGVIVGGDAPLGTIQGVGTAFGAGCTDGEIVTAEGIAKGFTQPPVDGCWEHQAYELSYWSGLGYISLMQSDPSGYSFPDGTSLGSAFLALGGTLGTPTGVPEPASWAMMLFGFGAIGMSMRGRRRMAPHPA